MALGQLAEQGPAVVDDEELGLVGRVQPRDLVRVGAQEGRLAAVAVAEQVDVRRLGQVEADRREVALVEAEQQPAVVGPGQLAHPLEGDLGGQQAQLGPARPGPRPR